MKTSFPITTGSTKKGLSIPHEQFQKNAAVPHLPRENDIQYFIWPSHANGS